MDNFFELINTEAPETWGGIIIIILLTLFFEHVPKNVFIWCRKKYRASKKKIGYIKQVLIYRRILKEEKKSGEITRPIEKPIGMTDLENIRLNKMMRNGQHLKYKKLDDKIRWYRDTVHERFEKWLDKNPEERERILSGREELYNSIDNFQESLNRHL